MTGLLSPVALFLPGTTHDYAIRQAGPSILSRARGGPLFCYDRGRMLRSRLTAKITVVIIAVLILGFGAATIWSIRLQSQVLLEQGKLAARRQTETIVASIEGAMLQERPDVTRSVIQELRGSRPVEGLTIYRANGSEAFTDLSTLGQVMKNAELSKEVMENIKRMQRVPGATNTSPSFRQAVQTLKTQDSFEMESGQQFYVVHQPVENQEKCQGCHGADHKVRAVVRVATSMEPVFAETRRQRNSQLVIAALTIFAAGAVMTVAMRRVVVRPIDTLAGVARRVGDGDFDARVPVGSHDEIGALAATFNDMTARLAQARTDLETKNAELGGALQSLQESRQRLELLEQLKGELSKFVPESVKKLLEQSPNATELEKKNAEVSVLFLDIAGYTKLSESLEPRKLNQLVQTYFTSFLEIIQAHHGDVNETAGDGLMVIFQSERGGSDNALNATQAAFAIRQRTERLNEEYGGIFPAIQLHMGINTGEALIGATKLGTRWTFTATGPTTNIAARFAGSAVGGEIIVGPATAERIRQTFVLESLGERSFKNVSQPIGVFKVIPPGVYEKIS
ncbi:MAG: HAMP domain-containing protein [Candidatus Rokubacteria bacterium]|nr:HAMP domain-containing protein [Candidatus Rokubacteria bacterium]